MALTMDQAEKILRDTGAFAWLLDGPAAMQLQDWAKRIKDASAPISSQKLREIAANLPHTLALEHLDMTLIMRKDLVLFFASQMPAAASYDGQSHAG